MLHPAMLGALALLVVNDHLLKDLAAGTAFAVVTGKLSDVAGLAFFPVLLSSLIEVALAALGRPWGPSWSLARMTVVVTAVSFALMKTWPPAAALYREVLATLQWPFHAVAALVDGRPVPGRLPVSFLVDPTDLLALPGVALALRVSARRLVKWPTGGPPPEAPQGTVC